MSTSAAYNALSVSNTFTFPHGDSLQSVSPNPGALFFEDNTESLYVGTRNGWIFIGGGDFLLKENTSQSKIANITLGNNDELLTYVIKEMQRLQLIIDKITAK